MNLKNLIKPIIIILILLVISLVVYFLRGIVLPLLIAFIISFILSPVTNWFQRLGFKHTTSVIIIFLLFISITLLLVVFVGPVLTREISTFKESFKSNIGVIINSIQATVSKTSFFAEKFEERNLSDILVEKVSSSAGTFDFFTILPKVGSLFIYIIVIPFATFFFLRDGAKMRKNLIELIPNRYFETTLDLMYKLNRQLKNYMIGITISASIVGLLAIIGLWIIGLNYFVFVGIFTGITNTIPYLGPIIGVILASIIAIITGQVGIGMFLKIILVFVVVNLIENAFVSPIVVARACKLHPLLVIISIIIGGKIAGLIGMFLGVPVASMIQVIIQTINISIVKSHLGAPEVQQEMP